MAEEQETHQSSLQFLQMNDDCIMLVMSYLDAKHLYHLAFMSSRLQKLAQSVFSRKGLILELCLSIKEWSREGIHSRIFGSHARTIRCVFYRDHNMPPANVKMLVGWISRWEKLEHLEINRRVTSSSDLDPTLHPLWDALSKFEKLRSLKVYSAYTDLMHLGIMRLKNHLTEYVFGYFDSLTVENLFTMIENGVNLQRLLLIGYNGRYIKDNHTPFDAEIYQRMLNIIQNRPNKKPLHIILVIVPLKTFLTNFPTQKELRITCLSHEHAISILGSECHHSTDVLAETNFQLSTAGMAKLFNHKFQAA